MVYHCHISWDGVRTYSHLDEIYVTDGQYVYARTKIATMGDTGYVTYLQEGWGVLHVEITPVGVNRLDDPREYAPWK